MVSHAGRNAHSKEDTNNLLNIRNDQSSLNKLFRGVYKNGLLGKGYNNICILIIHNKLKAQVKMS